MSKKYLDLDGLEEVVEQINAKYANKNEIPTTPAEVGAMPANTKYGASVTASVNTSTYVCTFQLKEQDGNNIGNPATIDLPIESAIVNASYDNTTKDLTFTLQNGNTVTVPMDDIISGLQAEITSSNKLSADLVDDTSTTNKFVTASDKTTWNGKQDALVSGTNIKTINGSSILGSGDLDTRDVKELPSGSYTNLWTLSTGVYKGQTGLMNYSTGASLPSSVGQSIVIINNHTNYVRFTVIDGYTIYVGASFSGGSSGSYQEISTLNLADTAITTAEIENLF